MTSAVAFITGTTFLTTDGRWDPGKDFIGASAYGPTQKFMTIWRTPKPVIAQVHGWCVGGGSDMALCADLVIASEDAQIGTPYSRIWGCYLSGMWIYRLGLTKAKEHALTGKPLSGREAAEIELINLAVPFEQLEATVDRAGGTAGAAIPLVPAGGDEADRQPGLREHGPAPPPRRWARSWMASCETRPTPTSSSPAPPRTASRSATNAARPTVRRLQHGRVSGKRPNPANVIDPN